MPPDPRAFEKPRRACTPQSNSRPLPAPPPERTIDDRPSDKPIDKQEHKTEVRLTERHPEIRPLDRHTDIRPTERHISENRERHLPEIKDRYNMPERHSDNRNQEIRPERPFPESKLTDRHSMPENRQSERYVPENRTDRHSMPETRPPERPEHRVPLPVPSDRERHAENKPDRQDRHDNRMPLPVERIDRHDTRHAPIPAERHVNLPIERPLPAERHNFSERHVSLPESRYIPNDRHIDFRGIEKPEYKITECRSFERVDNRAPPRQRSLPATTSGSIEQPSKSITMPKFPSEVRKDHSYENVIISFEEEPKNELPIARK